MLKRLILDGGRAAREYIEIAVQQADTLIEVHWCYSSLVSWNEDGISSIVRVALSSSKIKFKSSAISMLSALATTGKLPRYGSTPLSFPLIEIVEERIDRSSIVDVARKNLRLLILSLPAEDLLLPLSMSISQIYVASLDGIEELTGALGTKWFRFGPRVLDAYESLLTEKSNDEPAFQDFLTTYPQLLDPMATQVWPQPVFHGALEPDFVIRRADDTYLVVEIECPGKKMMTQTNRPSQSAAHAEAQALEYEDFLSTRIVEARTVFPNYKPADCLSIIGLEHELTPKQRAGLDRANSRKRNSRIVGFDWLLERARFVLKNISENNIDIIERKRII